MREFRASFVPCAILHKVFFGPNGCERLRWRTTCVVCCRDRGDLFALGLRPAKSLAAAIRARSPTDIMARPIPSKTEKMEDSDAISITPFIDAFKNIQRKRRLTVLLHHVP